MCTLTFVPRQSGYLLAMNRDESLARPAALPPQSFRLPNGARAVYPREPGGGTWIAANQAGMSFALLNRHTAAAPPKLRSRGEVIPQLVSAETFAEVDHRLRALPLAGMLPFRLLAIAPDAPAVLEAAWDGAVLERRRVPWEPRQWFSSGLSDELAGRYRGAVARAAWRAPGAGSPGWARLLHRSHAPARGPFSFCVHRPGVATVSYTEIERSGEVVLLRYRPGSPCRPAAAAEVALRSVELSLPARRAFHSLIA